MKKFEEGMNDPTRLEALLTHSHDRFDCPLSEMTPWPKPKPKPEENTT